MPFCGSMNHIIKLRQQVEGGCRGGKGARNSSFTPSQPARPCASRLLLTYFHLDLAPRWLLIRGVCDTHHIYGLTPSEKCELNRQGVHVSAVRVAKIKLFDVRLWLVSNQPHTSWVRALPSPIFWRKFGIVYQNLKCTHSFSISGNVSYRYTCVPTERPIVQGCSLQHSFLSKASAAYYYLSYLSIVISFYCDKMYMAW